MPKVRVGVDSDFPEGEVKVVDAAGRRFALGRVDGSLFAFDDVCTHDDGPLGEGELDGFEVECPRHGARFDIRTGNALCLPAVRGISTYPVTVEDDAVYVEAPG